ncbi:MAG: helix-turn-helix transcriptional regulator [Bacteroidales bacterium]|nr:helix-turn-helix transcriptional regulator [Bacteroidales bacterium]MCF8458811.1 helix-turn-helix transcriptional regulator [Bacteroidales bacterium]
MENKLELEEKFRKLAKKINISHKEMADAMEMTPQNLNRIFRANSIETKYLNKLCSKYKVPHAYFFSPTDSLVQDADVSRMQELETKVENLQRKLDTIRYILTSHDL